MMHISVSINQGNLLGCVMTSAWSYGLTRVLASAGGIGTSITAFTMTLEIIGVRETVPLLPWVTVSTLLANFAAIPTAIGEIVPSLVSDDVVNHTVFSCVSGGLRANRLAGVPGSISLYYRPDIYSLVLAP